jgi:hypothetical protein
MAVVRYGNTVTELKGAVQGAIFQKCGQSLSMRSKLDQRVSGSVKSVNVRNQFRIISGAWRSLTPVQRATWFQYAPTYPFTDKFGSPFVATAYQVFMSLNRNMLSIGQSLVLTCAPYAPSAIAILNFTAFLTTPQTFYYSFPVDPYTANDYLVFFISNSYFRTNSLTPFTFVNTGVWVRFTAPSNVYNAFLPFMGQPLYNDGLFRIKAYIYNKISGIRTLIANVAINIQPT